MSDRSYIDQQDYITAGIRQEAAVEELQRARALNKPSAIYRPGLFQDGNAWCALLGRDIAVGVVGWGDTPAEAMAAFDVAWVTKATTAGRVAASDGFTAPHVCGLSGHGFQCQACEAVRDARR